ncbi:MAG: antitoxin VapB family protein [Sulfolobus sp.]|nr:antitoxin VapB family protein [Sulfolobus sp.]
MARQIMVSDEVYEKLKKIKGDKSFSEVIDEMIEKAYGNNFKALSKYFGILSEEAEEIGKEIEENRKRYARSRNYGDT